jgi:predicted nucleic acid-binding protein
MESLISAAETIREEGTIFAPAGQGRVAFVAASDVAAVAAKVLTSPGHEDATYVVTGPEALGYADVAARISAVFARQVDYVDQPAEEAREMMLASGMGHWEADGVLEQFDWIRAGGADSVTGTVSEVTGSDPRPIEDWLADRRATFLAPPLDLPPPTG